MKMRTKRGRENADETRTKLPRGFRVREMRDGRPLPFLLIVHGKAKGSFETRREAEAQAAAERDREREFGRELRYFDVAEWRRYVEAKRKHFGGMEPDWARLAEAAGRSGASMTIAEAVTKYLALRDGDSLSAGTKRQMKTKLDRFAETFGKRQLDAVSTEDVRGWLRGLGFEPWTLRDHLKILMTFYATARREKWCMENPCDAVTAPRIKAEAINILTVEETRKLFDANRGLPVAARMALEAFGGLRASSAGRLLKSDIHWQNRGIDLPGAKHKSGRRHYIDGLPDNLWRWLEAAPDACWALTERDYAREKAAAFVRAGVTATHNCLRHSFCTYHVAVNKDAAATAVLMQHTSPALLWRFYKGRATADEGRGFFAIV